MACRRCRAHRRLPTPANRLNRRFTVWRACLFMRRRLLRRRLSAISSSGATWTITAAPIAPERLGRDPLPGRTHAPYSPAQGSGLRFTRRFLFWAGQRDERWPKRAMYVSVSACSLLIAHADKGSVVCF